MTDDRDVLMRAAAFAQVERLAARHDTLTAEHLRGGFVFEHERVPLINPQRGIFKPRAMRHLLSIKTVFPRPGGRVRYDDQHRVHEQLYAGSEAVDYAFMGQDLEAADNRWLREAHENGVPLIHCLGVSPGRYQAIWPVFVGGWDARGLRARIVFGEAAEAGVALAPPETAAERRRGLRRVQRRLHRARLRAAVIAAYGGRCALSRPPGARPLDAAHIVAGRDEALSQPVVPIGPPRSKLHHAAFDARPIGVDPDFRPHVSERLLGQDDGPMLTALKALHGRAIHLPARERDRPDRERLAARFELFRAGA